MVRRLVRWCDVRWPSGRCTMCESGGRLRTVACWPSLAGRPLIRSRRSTSLSSARVTRRRSWCGASVTAMPFCPARAVCGIPEQGHSGSTSAAAWSAELVIVPEGELVEALGDDVSLTCAPGEITSEGSRCAVAALHRSLRSGDRLAIEVELTSVAHSLFVHRPSVRLARSATADRRLRAARDLLVDRLAENVTLAELAGVAGMDRFHFARQFKATFGQPPHAYRLHLRLLRAQRALEHGRPVAEVAATSGFFDQSHLHRHFQRWFGLSPVRYASAFTRSARAEVAE